MNIGILLITFIGDTAGIAAAFYLVISFPAVIIIENIPQNRKRNPSDEITNDRGHKWPQQPSF